jgi:hypothetical protein
MLSVIMLSVIILRLVKVNVVILSVIILIVLALGWCSKNTLLTSHYRNFGRGALLKE